MRGRTYCPRIENNCEYGTGWDVYGVFMNMKKIIFGILLLSFFGASFTAHPAFAEEKASTLKDSIIYAIKNNPNIKSYGAKVDYYFANIGIATAAYMPNLSASGAYTKSGSQTATTSENYNDALSLNQLIYDFNQTNLNIKIQKESFHQSQYQLYDKIQEISLYAITSYYDVLKNRHLVDAYTKNVESNEKTYLQAKTSFEVGTRSKIDVTTASVNLSNARLSLINAKNDLKISIENYYNALSIQGEPKVELQDIVTSYEFFYKPEELTELAFKTRRDIMKLASQITAAKMQKDSYQAQYFPTLNGAAGLSWAGAPYPLPRGWNVGLNLTWALFNGGQREWQITQSKSNIKDLEYQLAGLKDNAKKEVYTNYDKVIKLLEAIFVAKEALRQATENEELAMERYRVGIGSIIEQTDAQSKKIKAAADYYNSVYQYNSAKATLDKSLGLDLAQVYCK